MTINLDLQPETQQKLEMLARKSGKDVVAFIKDLVERSVQSATASNFDAILEPFRQGFEERGLSEAQLAELMESELKAVRAERRAKKHANE